MIDAIILVVLIICHAAQNKNIFRKISLWLTRGNRLESLAIIFPPSEIESVWEKMVTEFYTTDSEDDFNRLAKLFYSQHQFNPN